MHSATHANEPEMQFVTRSFLAATECTPLVCRITQPWRHGRPLRSRIHGQASSQVNQSRRPQSKPRLSFSVSSSSSSICLRVPASQLSASLPLPSTSTLPLGASSEMPRLSDAERKTSMSPSPPTRDPEERSPDPHRPSGPCCRRFR